MRCLDKKKEEKKQIAEDEEKAYKLHYKIEKLKKEVKNEKRKLNLKNRSEAWKQRNHTLIRKGGLLEIAKILEEEDVILLGYFMKFNNLTETQKEDCRVTGTLEFRKRQEKKANKKKREREE